MKNLKTDIAVIGAGPAGLAAAIEAKKQGMEKVLILERDREPGGILQQCIHDGFGIHRFGKRMSGNQYAQSFIDEAEACNVETKLDTMVLEVTDRKEIYACNGVDGMLKIDCGAVILAMGCRERTASQVLIFGDRPAGVMTAGAVQRYINMEGHLPGKNALILGSGDIGLIMARRMTLEGMQVKGVYEMMPNPGGLTRNVVQCLDDYGIPLHTSTTVTWVHGKKRVNAVTVAKVDADYKPIAGTEEKIDCDLLVLAVGLIPENELSKKAGVEIDPRTKGPVVDNTFMTSVPGIFAAGNVAVVFDLVDYVSQSGEIAARGAVAYMKGQSGGAGGFIKAAPGENVSFVVPQRLCSTNPDETIFFMRVKQPEKIARLECRNGEKQLLQKNCRWITPSEMLTFKLETDHVNAALASGSDVRVDMYRENA